MSRKRERTITEQTSLLTLTPGEATGLGLMLALHSLSVEAQFSSLTKASLVLWRGLNSDCISGSIIYHRRLRVQGATVPGFR